MRAVVAPYNHEDELESHHPRLPAIEANSPYNTRAILLNCIPRSGLPATMDSGLSLLHLERNEFPSPSSGLNAVMTRSTRLGLAASLQDTQVRLLQPGGL